MIHVLNKKEQAIAHEQNVAWFKKIEKKKNVILMGDSLHDVDMAEGVKDIKTCLRIGFLNDKVDELLEHYKKGKKVGSYLFVTINLLKSLREFATNSVFVFSV